MTFSFTVLGSSAAIPANNRQLSAHLINADERLFLIDCGEGTQFHLKKWKISMQRIRHILISHLHGDHFFGLIGLMNSMHLLGRRDELHIYGPPRLMEILDLQLDVSMTRLAYPVTFHPLTGDVFMEIYCDARFTVSCFPLKHSVPTWGFLFREINPPRKVASPRSFAYCSDTAYDTSIIPHISGVSLLYHEATFMEAMAAVAKDKFHSTAREAAAIASAADVKRLVLGHFSARYEDLQPLLLEAQSVFPASFLAQEGQRIDI